MLPELREQRALGTVSGPAGGYTVPQGFYRVLEDAMLAYGGMRQARTTILRTASGEPLPMPTANDTDNEGIIISENPSTKVPEQDITFGQETLRAHMYSSKAIRVSFQLLQDSAFRSEERRVGKECRSRWSPSQYNDKSDAPWGP